MKKSEGQIQPKSKVVVEDDRNSFELRGIIGGDNRDYYSYMHSFVDSLIDKHTEIKSWVN